MPHALLRDFQFEPPGTGFIHDLEQDFAALHRPVPQQLFELESGHDTVDRRPDREQFGLVFQENDLLLGSVDLMVGNSSSGLLEAPSFELPVVNIGSRQEGRERAVNVLDCAPSEEAILVAIRRALEPAFRRGLAGLRNPYGDGFAAERIVRRLAEVALDEALVKKRFVDLERPPPPRAGSGP